MATDLSFETGFRSAADDETRGTALSAPSLIVRQCSRFRIVDGGFQESLNGHLVSLSTGTSESVD